jgi:hypothetical protein
MDRPARVQLAPARADLRSAVVGHRQQRVIGRDFDRTFWTSSGLRPNLGQSPGLCYRLPQNADTVAASRPCSASISECLATPSECQAQQQQNTHSRAPSLAFGKSRSPCISDITRLRQARLTAERDIKAGYSRCTAEMTVESEWVTAKLVGRGAGFGHRVGSRIAVSAWYACRTAPSVLGRTVTWGRAASTRRS